MTTLGRELQRRGHRVTVVGRLDARRKAESAGLNFAPIGEEDFPEGSMQTTSRELGRLSGLKAVQFTAELLRRSVVSILRDAPPVVDREKIDALLVDQVSPAGGTVADLTGRPWVMVSNALALNPDPHLPPCVLPWDYQTGILGRWRNAFGDTVLKWLARPIIAEINRLGTTVLLVEQNTRQALSLSRRGYVLENGRIALEGSGAELLGNEHVRRAYLGM